MYNQEGKLEEWWTNATSAGFQKKLDCIVTQYSGVFPFIPDTLFRTSFLMTAIAYTIDDENGNKVHVNVSFEHFRTISGLG